MVNSPLHVARRHVLGDLYARCERSDRIPVYLNDASGEKLGYVDEGLGKYADAFTFYLSDDHCKLLAGGKFQYSFDYHFSESAVKAVSPGKRRIKLISIFLTVRKGYSKPVSRSAQGSSTPSA